MEKLSELLGAVVDFLGEVVQREPETSRCVEVEDVRPEDIKVGDVVMIPHVVKSIAPAVQGGAFNHIHAMPQRNQLWQSGDQECWTWGWSMKNEGKLVRIVEQEGEDS